MTIIVMHLCKLHLYDAIKSCNTLVFLQLTFQSGKVETTRVESPLNVEMQPVIIFFLPFLLSNGHQISSYCFQIIITYFANKFVDFFFFF